MKFKLELVLITSYLVAFFVNLIPSIKHPDLNLNIYNLIATILFLIVLWKVSKEKIKKKKDIKIQIFLIFGVIAGILIYAIKMFESNLYDHFILDLIASIQYPLYLIFITPFFGANILFDLNYATFSLLISFLYIVIYSFLFIGFMENMGKETD